MEFLQEYFLIALDVFRKFPYPKDRSEQTAWLSLLTTEDLKDAERVLEEYPWLEEIYEEIAMLRQKPEEVLDMFSEALRILDQNTLKYMIEELQKEVDEVKEQKEQLEAVVDEKQKLLETIMEQKEAVLKENKGKDNEIAELKRKLRLAGKP